MMMSTGWALFAMGCWVEPSQERERSRGWRDADADGYSSEEDCDDSDPSIHPGAWEVCNQRDDDCDGLIDAEDEDCQLPESWPDRDGDGYGDLHAHPTLSCELPEDYVWESGDCDDSDPLRSPGAQETCEPGDEDCDGLEDEEDPSLDLSSTSAWWLDEDGDGWGQGTITQRCEPQEGEVPAGALSDCDDSSTEEGPCWDLDQGWSLVSKEGAADLGLSMAWAHDGEGAPALWLGAPGEGGLVELSGSWGQSIPEERWWLHESGKMGTRLSGGGADLQGARLAVSDPYASDQAGTVLLLPLEEGIVSPWEGALEWSGAAGELLGMGLAGGDLDGDGLSDWALGAPGLDGGRVYLLVSGEEQGEGASEEIAWQIHSESEEQDSFGKGLLLMDVDGDGLSELLVSDPEACCGDAQGRVYLFDELSGGVISAEDADEIWTGGDRYARLGWQLGSAGDLNQDGLLDLWISQVRVGEEDSGALWLLPGGSLSGTLAYTAFALLEGESSEGAWVAAAAGDLNQDGWQDLMVGARYAEDGGRAYWIPGPLEGSHRVSQLAEITLRGAQADGELGASMLGARDLNGDGWVDGVIAAPSAKRGGVVYIWSGSILGEGWP